MYSRQFQFILFVLAKPYILRIVKTVTYMLYLIHLNACAYYKISDWEGIGNNTFVYDGEGNSYIRCFYFATKVSIFYGCFKRMIFYKSTNFGFILSKVQPSFVQLITYIHTFEKNRFVSNIHCTTLK